MRRTLASAIIVAWMAGCGTKPGLRENWARLNRHLENFDSTLYFYNSGQLAELLASRSEAEKLFTADSVRITVSRVYEFALKDAYDKRDTVQIKKLENEIHAHTGSEAARILAHIKMSDYYDRGDFTNYSAVASDYVDKYCMDNEGQLGWSAWAFYEHTEDTILLQKALGWSSRAIELAPIYANMDTYAHLCFKLGRKEEARQMLIKAIEKAKKEGEDYKSSEDLLALLTKE
ncbi:MAG: hypothetical protein AB1458_11165 [Bacteroidota bacterium]